MSLELDRIDAPLSVAIVGGASIWSTTRESGTWIMHSA